MFTRTLALSVLASLSFAFGCHDHGAAPARDGSLEVAVKAASTLEALPVSILTVTGLSSPFRARVTAPAANSASLRLPLPPGLYAVEWSLDGSPSVDGPSPAQVAATAPRVVVIEQGHASAVTLRATAARVEFSALAASGAPDVARLALR